MQSIIWCLALPAFLVIEARRTTPAGLRRFHALDPERARGVVDVYKSRIQPWLLGMWGATNTMNGVFAAANGDAVDAAVSAVAVALLLALLVLHLRNRSIILAEAETREIAVAPEIAPRDASRRRLRRQREFGAVAIGALVTFPALLAVGDRLGSTLLFAAGLVVLGLAVVAGLGFGWATAWVYGDEQPAA